MIEMCHLKHVAIFFQTILSFILSRKNIYKYYCTRAVPVWWRVLLIFLRLFLSINAWLNTKTLNSDFTWFWVYVGLVVKRLFWNFSVMHTLHLLTICWFMWDQLLKYYFEISQSHAFLNLLRFFCSFLFHSDMVT